MNAITLLENLRAVFYAPFYVAITRDFFRDEGLEVHFLPSPDPGDTLPRLLAGEVDVCWGGPLRVIRTHERNPECGLVCFNEVVGRDPFFLVGRRLQGEISFDALRGKRVGVVSEVPTPWVCLRQDLADAGFDLSTMEVVTGRTMAENAAALARGELDAFQAFQPYVERAAAAPDCAVLYAAATRGPTAYTCFYTVRRTFDRNQAAFRALGRACQLAVRAVYEEGGAGIADALRQYFPDEPVELLGACVDRYVALGLYNPTGILPGEGFERLRRAMLGTGYIRRGASFTTCVDNRLFEE